MPRHTALSVPHGETIASGLRTIEAYSWCPPVAPFRDLLVVEHDRRPSSEGDRGLHGRTVAFVDVQAIEPRQPSQVQKACATPWKPGYDTWPLCDIRPRNARTNVPAERSWNP